MRCRASVCIKSVSAVKDSICDERAKNHKTGVLCRVDAGRFLNGASIIGRMGLPHYRESCSIITIVMDSTIDTINALCGKLGRLKHVQVKSMMAK